MADLPPISWISMRRRRQESSEIRLRILLRIYTPPRPARLDEISIWVEPSASIKMVKAQIQVLKQCSTFPYCLLPQDQILPGLGILPDPQLEYQNMFLEDDMLLSD